MNRGSIFTCIMVSLAGILVFNLGLLAGIKLSQGTKPNVINLPETPIYILKEGNVEIVKKGLPVPDGMTSKEFFKR